jgi:hypothetical protein
MMSALSLQQPWNPVAEIVCVMDRGTGMSSCSLLPQSMRDFLTMSGDDGFQNIPSACRKWAILGIVQFAFRIQTRKVQDRGVQVLGFNTTFAGLSAQFV